jgi:hypothetical protein
MARFRRPRRSRSEGRLDPVRWRRPGRGTLLRFGVIAVLLITAAFLSWSGPETCASPTNQAGTAPTAAAKSKAGAATTPAAASAGGAAPSSSGVSGAREGGSDAVEPSRERAVVPPGRVGVPVRLAEPTALALVRPGDHVDLIRVGEGGQEAHAIAAAALVLGVTGADDPTTGGLLIALTPAEATKAVAKPGGGFAVLIRP